MCLVRPRAAQNLNTLLDNGGGVALSPPNTPGPLGDSDNDGVAPSPPMTVGPLADDDNGGVPLSPPMTPGPLADRNNGGVPLSPPINPGPLADDDNDGVPLSPPVTPGPLADDNGGVPLSPPVTPGPLADSDNGGVALSLFRLHPKNCLGVRQFAETMMCAVLYDAANRFIHEHFVEVSMDLVDEAKDYHLMPERRPHLLAFKTRPRCCTSIAGLIYAVGGLNSAGDSLNVVEVFDPIANRWEKCQPMTTARSRVGVAVVNGLLYAIGGYDGQSRLSTVEVYNPETDVWTKVGSMNSKRR
ncbi:hypothetical protein AB205_0004600 [Aquarana catesbeiana]|uniref:BACK domain-containing protein n=1 Tax=Aquarana catesbeiana TaxID=8400 RepID=A0A2G9QF34_AQUCT|nr:hypothetical protein AB205_0004600 [Aquarana catesbeiana]